MGRLLFIAVKNTIIACLGLGVFSAFLMLLMMFLMADNIIVASGMIIFIVFVICLWNAYGERNDDND